MKKKLFIGMTAILLTMLISCPQESNSVKPIVVPDVLVKAISVAGVNVTPLPQPSATIEDAEAVSVVVNTERLPTDTEDPNKVWYKPAQPIAVTLANTYQNVFYEVTRPGEDEPYDIVLPPTEKNGAVFTRNIGIILPNDDGFQIGQVVWIKVVAADESKTEYYKINVVNQTHDTALNIFTIGGYNVLNTDHSGHIGPWFTGATWADAVNGLVNLKDSEISTVDIAVTPRNNAFDLAKPKIEFAKTTVTASSTEPADWSTEAPTSFTAGDVLALKITASNGKNTGYMKVNINVGGSSFLASLKVNNNDITLGSPSMDIKTVGPAYRVEEGRTLTGSAVTWAVTPVAADTHATVTWALAAKGATPSAFNNSTSFDTNHNYLYIKVVSQNGSTTMYYLVIYDERPKDTEHIRTGLKNVPIYRFTIPAGKTWGDLGEYPRIRIKIMQEEAEFNQADGYQRNFVMGEVSRMPTTPTVTVERGGATLFDADNLFIHTGGATFNIFMPFYINKQAKAWAVDMPGNVPAPGVWYIIEYPLATSDSWRPPWDLAAATKPGIINNYGKDTYWPEDSTTGDVLFGIGITHDANREYWIKEMSLVSTDGTFIVTCDLLGNGRIDSDTQDKGFVRVDQPKSDGTGADVVFLRELVADPTLR